MLPYFATAVSKTASLLGNEVYILPVRQKVIPDKILHHNYSDSLLHLASGNYAMKMTP